MQASGDLRRQPRKPPPGGFSLFGVALLLPAADRIAVAPPDGMAHAHF